MLRAPVGLFFASILGAIAGCSANETSHAAAVDLCDPSLCDSTAPGAPASSTDATAANYLCADGTTVAGPACVASSADTCSWAIVACPEAAACGSGDCAGPAPEGPSYVCKDGTVAGPVCTANDGGTCAWTVIECSADPNDPPVICNDCDGTRPDAPSQLCKDGTVAGPACVATTSGVCEWTITQCPEPQPTDCTVAGCATGQHCETNCYPCDAPDPMTPCDSFACQSSCVAN